MDGIGIEPAGVFQGRVGDAGLSRKAWRALAVRGLDASAELVSAGDAGVVPHLLHAGDPKLGAAVGRLVRAWSAERRLVLLGDAGAVRGASVLGLPAGTVCITDPDEAMRTDVAGAGLIVLGSAPWVVAARGDLGARATRTWQVDGDGTAETTPRRKGQRRLVIPGGADPRFVTCSPVTLALGSLAGADPDLLVDTLHRFGAMSRGGTRADNPALALAHLAVGLAEGPGRGAPVLLVPASLLGAARHAVRVWRAFTTRPRQVGAVRHLPAGLALTVERGDEVAASALLHGPADVWTLQVVSPGALSTPVDEAWSQALAEAGMPTAQLRGIGGDPRGRLALVALVTQAAVLTALHLGLEPLALPGADRLREVQQARGLDTH